MLSSKTIAVSKKTKRQITRRVPFLKKKIIVIYNGVEDMNFMPREKARKYLMSIEKTGKASMDAFWIGTTGELHHIKGHEYLIDAISEIRDHDLKKRINVLIMGEGEERKHLEKLIRNKQLQKNVFLLGWVDNAREYLKSLDVFVFPSLSEAFPYSILTAGQAGLPIIASRVGGIPEVIEDKVNGMLVSQKDIFELRDNIVRLAEDRKKMAQYGAQIKQDISSRFLKERMIKETIDVYKI